MARLPDALAELLAVARVRRQVLEASLGRQVLERDHCKAVCDALGTRVVSLAGEAASLRDEAVRREHGYRAAARVLRASIEVVRVRRGLVATQLEVATAGYEEAAARVVATNRKLVALAEREREYRRMASAEALARDELADDEA